MVMQSSHRQRAVRRAGRRPAVLTDNHNFEYKSVGFVCPDRSIDGAENDWLRILGVRLSRPWGVHGQKL